MHKRWIRNSLIPGIPVAPQAGSVTRKGRTRVHVYLVERYWPGVTGELLRDALSRGRQMEQMRTDETPVHHVISILVPDEEVVFSLYEGQSTLAVRQHNERAAIPVSRIATAITMESGEMGEKGNLLDMGEEIFANLAEQGPQFWFNYEQYKLSRAQSARAGVVAEQQAAAGPERDAAAQVPPAKRSAPRAAG